MTVLDAQVKVAERGQMHRWQQDIVVTGSSRGDVGGWGGAQGAGRGQGSFLREADAYLALPPVPL